MNDPDAIRSDAFARATLRSERFRILGILVVFAILTAAAVTRSVLRPREHELLWLGRALAMLGVAVAYELIMLRLVRRAERSGDRMPRTRVWVFNTVIECSIPTVALVGLTEFKSFIGPWRALVAPTIIIYCMFIVLSTLRLSQKLSILAGLVSAAGYVTAYAYNVLLYPNRPERNVLPPEAFVVYPFMLLATGFVAGGVARQLRAHVIAALEEAETRRKLDRIEGDLKIARSIQMGLLPKAPPNVKGYDVAGWSQPADQTGGDYYDWIELPGGKVMFTIADASGHGIGPALLVAACRAYFRAIASHVDPLERIAQQVDALIANDVTDGRFITAAIALLDPAANRLSLYSAGHAPIYHYVAREDRVNVLDADQPPLGTMFDLDGDSRACTIDVSPGDELGLITDGFFECRDRSNTQFGTARLGESVRRHQTLPADQAIQQFHREVIAFTNGTPQADDMTAVVIKRVQID